MARIFISHSSVNNAEAAALRDWLAAQGWADLFLDFDPDRGIAAGERWEQALSEAANRCEAVIFLVSRNWLQSKWCLREFHLALKLNKRVFALLLEDIPKADLPAELVGSWQVVDLQAGNDHAMFRAELPDGSISHVTFSNAGLARLRNGLTKAGLDARFFAWPPESDPDRAPYRGLRSLEAEDAGIFFGREAPTIEVLDRLRGLAGMAGPSVLAVLGASGAGKSSFLRAGLLPRLGRDDESFRVLPIVRPARAAISGDTGLLRSLELGLAMAGAGVTRASVREAIGRGAEALAPMLRSIATAGRASGGDALPAIVLPIDQGEELFQADGAEEAAALLDLAMQLARLPDLRVIVLVTIRSDSFEALQTAPALESISISAFSLPPMPRGAYQIVIEGPAARLSETRRPLTVEPALTAKLLEDLEAGGSKDALPLLAFTLERLYAEHGGDGDLRRSEYEAIGGVRGAIEAAVEEALARTDADTRLPADRAARLALLRSALIPWLAGIDPDTNTPRRRVARMSEIPENARPLIRHLVDARLLISDRDAATGEQTVEPAHEALLRQWDLLEGWLEDDLAVLTTAESLRRAAREWEANGRNGDWLVHAAGRLEDAEALNRRPDIQSFIKDAADYLVACRDAERMRRARELAESQARLRRQRRLLIASLAASVVFAVVALFAVLQFSEASRNLNFALDATDNLALAVARGLETDANVPTREKTFFAMRLEESFRQLPDALRNRQDFGRRYADLLISNALMYFNVGRADLGELRLIEARSIVGNADDLPRAMRMRLALGEASGYLARLDLRNARAAIARGLAAAGDDMGTGYDAHVLSRLHVAMLDTLRFEFRFEDVAAMLPATREIVEEALATQTDPNLIRSVNVTLFGLTNGRFELDAEFDRPDAAISAEARAELDGARELFDGGRGPMWRYHDAYARLMMAKLNENEGNIAESVREASGAVAELQALSADDPGNALYRLALGEMLIYRARYAAQQLDRQQAEVDLDAARSLLLDVRQVVAPSVSSARLGGMIDDAMARLATAGGAGSSTASYERMIARASVWEEYFVEPWRLLDMRLFGNILGSGAYAEKGDLDRARTLGVAALDQLDSYRDAIGSNFYFLSNRYFTLQALMRALERDADPATWDSYHDQTLAAVDGILAGQQNNTAWRSNRAYTVGVRGQELADTDKRRAADAFAEALEIETEAMRLGAALPAATNNQIYYLREAIENWTELGDWPRIVAMAARAPHPAETFTERELTEFLGWSRSLTDVLVSADQMARKAGAREAGAIASSVDARRTLERGIEQRIAQSARTGANFAVLDPRKLDLAPVAPNYSNGNLLRTSARLGFSARPSLRGDWVSLFGDEFEAIRRAYAETSVYKGIADSIERIRVLDLPFYADGRLYEAEYADDRGGMPLAAIMIVDGKTYMLNGTSPPIHEANKASKLLLDTAEQARAYLMFFCAYITGSGSAFFIVENAADVHWRQDAPEALKSDVAQVLRPLHVWPDAGKPGTWHATATVQYSADGEASVFHAQLKYDTTGMVEMASDMPVATKLPIVQPLYVESVRIPRVVDAADLGLLNVGLISNEAAALDAIAERTDNPTVAELMRREAEALRARQ